jgi:predicted dehydrogenase
MGPRVRRFFASRNAERAGDFARRFAGEQAFDGLEAALADPRVDAVVLVLPHHLHAGAVRAALDAGKHVLVEKPIALDVEEGEELVRTAEAAGLCLAVAEQYRLSPLVQRVRRLLDEDLVGRISLVNAGVIGSFRPAQDWKNARDTMGGGVLLDVGVHYIDILRYWFGDPELVWAVTPPHLHDRFEGEDSIAAVLRFADGPAASLHISWSGFRSPEAPNLELIGERGALGLWFRKPYLLHSSPLPGDHWSRRIRRVLPWRIEQHARSLLPQARERRIPVAKGDLIGSRALIEDFVRAITTGAEPAVSGAEGLKDLRTVLAAYEAMRSGVPVDPFGSAGD